MRIIDNQGRDVQSLTNIERFGRILRSTLPNIGTSITTVSGTAYFVYMGRTTQAITPKFIEFWLESQSSAGGGGQTAEVGLFSTPSAPNRSTQTVTKLSAVALTALGTEDLNSFAPQLVRLVRRNNTAFTYSVPAGIHLWAGIRIAMTTNQPSLGGLCQDFSNGLILYTPAAGVLTGAGPWTGAIIPNPLGGVPFYLSTPFAPDLRLTLD